MAIDLLASSLPGEALEVLAPPLPPKEQKDSSFYNSHSTPSLSDATVPQGLRMPLQQKRFLGGETFFNYDACGSLRPDKPAIQLFSSRYVGLAIHVALTGFAFEFLTYGFGRLLAEYLKARDERQVSAANFVLVWPQSLSIIIGLLSDAFPLFGYRRKSYMVLGWVLTFVSCVVIIILDFFGDSGQQLFDSDAKTQSDLASARVTDDKAGNSYPIAFIVTSLVTAFAIQICWLSAAALSVEFAQREDFYRRGFLQATLVAIYYAGGFVARVVTALVVSEGVNTYHVTSTVSMGQAAMLLAGVSAFAIPFVLQCLDEERVVKTEDGEGNATTLAQRLTHFWRYCHHNIAYRTLLFVCLHVFFSSMYNQNVQDAVKQLCHVTTRNALVIDAGRLLVMVATMLVWRQSMRNWNWRKITFGGTAFFIVDYAVITLITAYDLARGQWVYAVFMYLGDAPWALVVLFLLVLATEISEIGYEGVTVALGISYQSLAVTAGYILASIFPDTFGSKVTMDQVTQDDATTRANVVRAFLIVLPLSLPSLFTPLLLPRQKLDAQQLHAFGGYNRHAGIALLVLFGVLLGFNLVASLMVVL